MKKSSWLGIVALLIAGVAAVPAAHAGSDNSKLRPEVGFEDSNDSTVTLAGRITSSNVKCRNHRLIKVQRFIDNKWVTTDLEPVDRSLFGVRFPAGSIGSARLLLTAKTLPSGYQCAAFKLRLDKPPGQAPPNEVSDVTNTYWVNLTQGNLPNGDFLYVGYLDSTVDACVLNRVVEVRRNVDGKWRTEGRDVVTSQQGIVALRGKPLAGAQLTIKKRVLKNGTVCDAYSILLA